MRSWIHTLGSTIGHWLASLVAVTPPTQWHLMPAYIAFIGLCLLGLISLPFLKVNPLITRRLAAVSWTNIFVGAILFFFRYQQIPYLGSDLWRFIQEVGTVVWLLLIFHYYRTDYQQELVERKIVEYKQKYLPKSHTR